MIGRQPHSFRAHAKINLGLAVLARETSGFHQIETIFCALELADDVEITLGGDGIRLAVEAPPDNPGATADLGAAAKNLAVRAARGFHELAGLPPDAHIRIVKRIPVAGGLGGGSSDAAAVLTGLNRLHGEPLDLPALLRLAASLGSDVPFFLARSPLAVAWGRGSRILPLPPLQALPVLLVVPAAGVATSDAYAELAAGRPHDYACPPAILPALPPDWWELAKAVSNDFEPVIFRRLPELAEMREALEGSGALMARMTGSGSTLFGVYPDSASAGRARTALAAAFPDAGVIVTRTLDVLHPDSRHLRPDPA